IVGITNGKATKLSIRVERPDDVQAALVHALHAAVTGRPGSVLVDLPRDVQVGRTTMRPWESLLGELDWARPVGSELALAEAARLLTTAARPVIYAGHGVVLANAADQLRELSHLLQAPVATTVHGLGLLTDEDPLSLGMLGMHGTIAAN